MLADLARLAMTLWSTFCVEFLGGMTSRKPDGLYCFGVVDVETLSLSTVDVLPTGMTSIIQTAMQHRWWVRQVEV